MAVIEENTFEGIENGRPFDANTVNEPINDALDTAIDSNKRSKTTETMIDKMSATAEMLEVGHADVIVSPFLNQQGGKQLHFRMPRGTAGPTPIITAGIEMIQPDEHPDVQISGTPEEPFMQFMIPKEDISEIENTANEAKSIAQGIDAKATQALSTAQNAQITADLAIEQTTGNQVKMYVTTGIGSQNIINDTDVPTPIPNGFKMLVRPHTSLQLSQGITFNGVNVQTRTRNLSSGGSNVTGSLTGTSVWHSATFVDGQFLFDTQLQELNQATGTSTMTAMSQNATTTALNTKQPTLVSSTNIRTINNQSLLGSGNIQIINSRIDPTSIRSWAVTTTTRSIAPQQLDNEVHFNTALQPLPADFGVFAGVAAGQIPIGLGVLDMQVWGVGGMAHLTYVNFRTSAITNPATLTIRYYPRVDT